VKTSLSTSIGTLTLERPTILASGILGISLNIFERLYRAGAGAVVTKSLSKEPWDGYANPTIFSVKGGGWAKDGYGKKPKPKPKPKKEEKKE